MYNDINCLNHKFTVFYVINFSNNHIKGTSNNCPVRAKEHRRGVTPGNYQQVIKPCALAGELDEPKGDKNNFENL